MSKSFRDSLKRITPLRKTVVFLRRVTYPKYRKLYDSLSGELNVLKSEFLNTEKNVSLLNEQLATARESIGVLEKSLNKESLLIKNRLSAFNTATNYILYEKELSALPYDKDYTPKVSIIMPVYNGEKYINQALSCALNQTYSNIEIIAVNDGSTDNTDEILCSYGDKITYINKENGGVSSALNAGIKEMTGEYFAWLSHDDLIDSDHIQNLVEYLRHHRGERVIPYSAFKLIDESGKLLVEHTVNARLNMFDYKISVTDKYAPLLFGEINGGSVLIPKEAFEKVGMFDENRRITQERDMWSRLIKAYRFVCVPYDTAAIRIHSDQVSCNRENVAEESNKKNLQIIDEIYDIIKSEAPQKASELISYLKLHYFCNSINYVYEELKRREESIGDENAK